MILGVAANEISQDPIVRPGQWAVEPMKGTGDLTQAPL